MKVDVDSILANTSRALAQVVVNYFEYIAYMDNIYDAFEKFYK